MLTILVSILCAILSYFYVYKPHQYWKNLKVPYIAPWPLVGNMGRIFLRINGFHAWVLHSYKAQQTKISGIFSFNVPILLVRDLDLIKQITIKEFHHFADHRNVVSEDIDPLFGRNLFTLKGEEWHKMRSIISPTFSSSKMKSVFALISACALHFKEYFSNILEDNEIIDIELNDTFTRFANDVIASTAFGIECNSFKDKNNEFYMMGRNIAKVNFRQVLKYFMYYVSKSLMRLLKVRMYSKEISKFFRNIVKMSIEFREKEGLVRPDMIHLLMEARNGKLKHETLNNDDPFRIFSKESKIGKNFKLSKADLTDDDITAQALLFFFAGFDSISKALIFLVYELVQYPDIQEKLQAEIDEALQNCKGDLSYETLMKMKYLDMVLNETLRKWPPTPVLDRMCTASFTIKAEDAEGQNINIPKDSLVWIPTYAIHHDPKYYPDPDKFNPERFSDKNKNKINPTAYMPFGIGPRSCIGPRFALMEMKTIIAYILSEFSLVLTTKSKIPVTLRTGDFKLNPAHELWIGLKRRKIK